MQLFQHHLRHGDPRLVARMHGIVGRPKVVRVERIFEFPVLFFVENASFGSAQMYE